ncbi:ABC transporter permease [Mesorhizobium sp.]|uniref:ABC transporter permease n=1 Tax=Mesorhizobium sp. TaxID=1871066 RepID=UPI000FE4C1B6|nr:ABC transporter permease [Mesorhizobium sp.]RWB69988.1 MAG: ABC transporter permease [Mesorhizobium sp.]
MFRETRWYKWFGRTFAVLFCIYVLIPLAITAVMAFSDDNIVRFPIHQYSGRWFLEFADNSQWMDAAASSLRIALLTAFMSMILAVPAAYALSMMRSLRSWLQTFLLLPLFVPGVVLGISLAIGIGDMSIFGTRLYGSSFLVACAHTLWAMPLAITVLEPSFGTVDRSLIEAAGDLGASPVRAFFNVTLHLVLTGVVSAALFAFITSLNEFIMALFLTSRDNRTLPVLLWLSLRSSSSPQLAVASIVLAGSVFSTIGFAYAWYLYQRHRRRLASQGT